MLRIVFLGIDPYPKPLICMRGFVASTGATLEEFTGDVRAILDAKIKNL
jgi:hypothetical protein